MQSASDIELEFDKFFREIGFMRVSHLVGDSPPFPNADYVHLGKNMVVELKVLDKDYFESGGIIDRFRAIVPASVDVKEDGTGIYTVSWPTVNREGRHDTFEEPLRRILKKANRQLRETKERLLESKGRGYVLFIMNGFLSLAPITVAQMLSELLFEEFSSISGYILCAKNPDLNCMSAMAPDLSKAEYDAWYLIAEKICHHFEQP